MTVGVVSGRIEWMREFEVAGSVGKRALNVFYTLIALFSPNSLFLPNNIKTYTILLELIESTIVKRLKSTVQEVSSSSKTRRELGGICS